MRRISLSLPLFALLAYALFAGPVQARELAVDLSETVVPITAGFTGSNLLLFGTMEPNSDVVVVVRGPYHDEVVRRKERALGVWVNGAEVTFDNVPSFYFIAANRPLEEFLTDDIAYTRQIGYDNLTLTPKEGQAKALPADADIDTFRKALIRRKQHHGLYGKTMGNVIFSSSNLFRTRLEFPSNVPVGQYAVDVFVIRDGRITDEKTTILSVQKFGVEAGVYSFAHRHALAYGVLAILLAGMAGWLASVVFRKG